MPYHKQMDAVLTNHQGTLAAGSTMRGIAPVYADKMFRHGIRMIDLTEPDILKEKLHKACQFNRKLINAISEQDIQIDEKLIYKDYLHAKRGKILDRNERVLSLDITGYSLEADLSIFFPKTSELVSLARILNTDKNSLLEDIQGKRGYIVLKKFINH